MEVILITQSHSQNTFQKHFPKTLSKNTFQKHFSKTLSKNTFQNTFKKMSVAQIITATAVNGQVDVPTGDLDRALQNMQTKQRKNKRKTKDPNAPKRAASAYMLWLNENRSSIKDELLITNPDAKITDVTKRAGEMWKELTDDEKAPFQEKSETLRAAYHEAMKVYKPDHTVSKKTKADKVVYDVDEIPEAPEGWNGPHTMKHLLRKVIGVDGKTVRIQKNFDAAVALANQINAAWKEAVDSGDVPSHWKTDVMPCAGITKTSTGYDLRLGPDLVETQHKDSNGGIASWTLTITDNYVVPEVVADVVPGVVADVVPGVTTPVATPEPVKTPDAPKKRGRKKQTDPAAASEAKKPIKIKTKASDAKKPMVSANECLEIEIERGGNNVALLLHEDSGNVFQPSNLFEPVATLADEEIVFL